MNQDYYKILGVSKTATDKEIKSAYRKLALEYHPDRNKTKEASEKFKEVTKAYEVLGDSQKRQTYDQYGAAAFEQGGFGGAGGPFGGQGQGGQYGPFTYRYQTNGQAADFDFGGFQDPFDIFEQFFGGGFGQQRQRRPVTAVTISLDEAYKGVEKKVTMNGKSKTVKIPKGVDSGQRIRFDDFDVVISVTQDKRFAREGADLIVEKELTFPQAALGTEASVTTLDGEVKVRIPQGTQPQTVMRLQGRGMPRLRGGGRGDLYIKLLVSVPTKLTRRQKELLEVFDEESPKKRWF